MLYFCSFNGNDLLGEHFMWPVVVTAIYFKVQYMTNNVYATIAFAYFAQTLSLMVTMLNHELVNGGHESAFVKWLVKHVFSLVTPLTGTYVCAESAVAGLGAIPMLAISGALLWHVGVEKMIGASYKRPTGALQHVVLWLTFFAFVAFGSRAIFTGRDDLVTRQHTSVDPRELDAGTILAAMMNVALIGLLPITESTKKSATAEKNMAAFRAYVIFSIFYLFIALFGALSGHFLGQVHSTYIRVLITHALLWATCVFVCAVRLVAGWCGPRRSLKLA